MICNSCLSGQPQAESVFRGSRARMISEVLEAKNVVSLMILGALIANKNEISKF